MQTTAPLQKDAAKASVSTTQGKTTTNPLQPVTGLSHNTVQTKQNPLQPVSTGQHPLQLLADTAKSTGNPLQSYAQGNPLQQSKKENKTGLPDKLKDGVENMSGYSLDDVKVHYNSDKPAQLQALAYAQGTDIHVGPGQEQHLPHEAWHVVQQKQGRVQPTMQMKVGVDVNDDHGLESEADTMGSKAIQQNLSSQKAVVQKTKIPWRLAMKMLGGATGLGNMMYPAVINSNWYQNKESGHEPTGNRADIDKTAKQNETKYSESVQPMNRLLSLSGIGITQEGSKDIQDNLNRSSNTFLSKSHANEVPVFLREAKRQYDQGNYKNAGVDIGGAGLNTLATVGSVGTGMYEEYKKRGH